MADEVMESLLAEEEEDQDHAEGEGEESDSDTILNGELILASSGSGSGLLSPLNDEDGEMLAMTTEPTEDLATNDDKPAFTFPEDFPPVPSQVPASSSGGTVGGDVESVVSVNSLHFTPNASSNQDYHKFIRRFISTQVPPPSSPPPSSHLLLSCLRLPVDVL
jgi:hypothetical protein